MRSKEMPRKLEEIKNWLNHLMWLKEKNSITQYGEGQLDACKEVWIKIESIIQNAKVVEIPDACEKDYKVCRFFGDELEYCYLLDKRPKGKECTAKRAIIILEEGDL